MNVYLMRHGIAQPKDDPKIGSDDERELTKKGAKKARKAAKGLRALKIPFDRIITSPLSRARETAEIVAKVFDMEEQVEEAPENEDQDEDEEAYDEEGEEPAESGNEEQQEEAKVE